MPTVDLPASPLVPGLARVGIHYRDHGSSPRSLLFLHGGWGYEIYPFERQIAALSSQWRIVIPDRSGYGKSGRLERLPADFHRRAAVETRAVIEALGLERPVLWGHSDGAIIALLMAIDMPDAIGGVIAEATHFYRRKPSSRRFFDEMLHDPRALGPSVAAALARDHGDSWPDVIARNALAWRQIAQEAASDAHDLYDGRLGGIDLPVMLLHGARDPRTEPGELEALQHALTDIRPPDDHTRHVVVVSDGAHSPHSERATADEATRAASDFLERFSRPADPAHPAR